MADSCPIEHAKSLGLKTRDGREWIVVTDNEWWIGDVAVLLDRESYIGMDAWEGPWMKGPAHGPGGDYRSATEEEWDEFRMKGFHLRQREITIDITLPSGEKKTVSKKQLDDLVKSFERVFGGQNG